MVQRASCRPSSRHQGVFGPCSIGDARARRSSEQNFIRSPCNADFDSNWFRGLDPVHRAVCEHTESGGTFTRRQTLQDAIYALLFFAALFALNLPVETYAGFIRLHQFGFSDESYLSWLSEQTINWVVLTSFYVVGVVLFFALIRRKPATWTRWALAVYVSLTALYVLVAPVYIEPLINHFEPMQSGPEKEAILSLARANGVNDADVFCQRCLEAIATAQCPCFGFLGHSQDCARRQYPACGVPGIL